MQNIEKSKDSKNWKFFENLRRFSILLIFRFDKLQNAKILTISKISKFLELNFF